MSYSKLKPYNYVGMRAGDTSRFGKKLSVREYFSFAARYLKDNRILQESMFEKPYLQNSRPQLHQDWSLPDWPSKPSWVGPGGEDNEYRKHTFIFNEGKCSLDDKGDVECGEQLEITTFLGAAPLFTLAVRDINFKAVSSNEEIAKVVSQDTDSFGNTTFIVELSEESGEASVCVSGTLTSGQMLKEISYLIPTVIDGVKLPPGWIPRLEYAFNNMMPLREKYTNPTWACGCIDIKLECGCEGATWDSVNSAETVAPSSSCTVYILGDYGGSDIEWTITGTGFWFDSGFTLTTIEAGKNVTVFTDASACGLATITACGATGYVRSTTGKWVLASSCGGTGGPIDCGGCIPLGCYGMVDTKTAYFEAWCSLPDPFTCADGGGCTGPCSAIEDCSGDVSAGNAICSVGRNATCEWACAGDPRANCPWAP